VYEALVVLAGCSVNLVFGNILEPRIMGRGRAAGGVPSLIFWGWLLGRSACCCRCR
jgi:AI-2 transport protein TqsA